MPPRAPQVFDDYLRNRAKGLGAKVMNGLFMRMEQEGTEGPITVHYNSYEEGERQEQQREGGAGRGGQLPCRQLWAPATAAFFCDLGPRCPATNQALPTPPLCPRRQGGQARQAGGGPGDRC